MNKKAKIALAIIKKVYTKFPETRKFIHKASRQRKVCCRENITVDELLFSSNNNY